MSTNKPTLSDLLRKMLHDAFQQNHFRHSDDLVLATKNTKPFINELIAEGRILQDFELNPNSSKFMTLRFAGIPIIEDPNLKEGQIVLMPRKAEMPPQYINCRNVRIYEPDGTMLDRIESANMELTLNNERWDAEFKMELPNENKPKYKAIFHMDDFTMTRMISEPLKTIDIPIMQKNSNYC